MCLSVSWCVSRPWPKKNDGPEICHTHSPRPYLKTAFLISQKSDPGGRYLPKNAMSRGFSAYLLDCLNILCVFNLNNFTAC